MIRTHLLYFILLFFPILLLSRNTELRFEHLTTEDGLSHNCVLSILQDRQGFMWFGTSAGLNRWDGYTFKTFMHDDNDSTSISNNTIWTLHQDSAGYIWAGTYFGLNRYDPETETFTTYLNDINDSTSLSDNIVGALFEDCRSRLWIGTEKGLNLYEREKDSFRPYYFPGQLDSVSFWWNNNTIRAINEDKNGRLLLGTSNDFILFDPQTNGTETVPYVIPEKKRWPQVVSICRDRSGTFWIGMLNDGVIEFNPQSWKPVLHTVEPGNPYSFSSLFSSSIREDKTGQLWIGTMDRGFCIYNRSTGCFTQFKPDSKDRNCLHGYIVNSIYEDKQGNIWIGTGDNGINMIPNWNKPFRFYGHDAQNTNSLLPSEVTNFYEDKNGVIWIVQVYGISLLDRKHDTISHLRYDPKKPAGIGSGAIYDVYEDRRGYIWLAIIPDLLRMDPGTGRFKNYPSNLSDPKSHGFTYTFCCCEDHEGTMWFGTQTAGLERLNDADDTFDHFWYDPEDSSSVSDNCINALYLDRSGVLWIGTGNGLCKYISDNTGKDRFKRYLQNPETSGSIRGKIVYAMYEDRTGRFWIGTNGGLNLFDREKGTFTAITQDAGLPCNSVMGILEDDTGISDGHGGNLWLRTPQGLVKYNPGSGRIRTYDDRDGLINCKSIDAGYAAFFKSKNGEIYAGGGNSVIAFHPDSIRDNPDPPEVVLTDLKVNYESLKAGKNTPLGKAISMCNIIRLSHDQNAISIEFAALDFTAPRKNLYVYRMEGINDEWVYTDAAHRSATYTNLDPGEYVFRVKGSNNDGVWNKNGTALEIIITPPWWKTNSAYIFYFVFCILLLFTLRRYDLKRQRLKHELALEHEHAGKLLEIDRMKSRFFANISHEFRTPLTLILGPVDQMLSGRYKGNLQEQYRMIQRNGKRLLRLINQLLDLSKLESGGMTLQVREENISLLLRQYVQAFESLARYKNIRLRFKAENDCITAYIDRDKLEKIMNNLLSNAFKFTPEGGQVEVTLTLRGSLRPKQSLPHYPDNRIVRDEGIASLSRNIGIARNDNKHPPQSPFVKGEADSFTTLDLLNLKVHKHSPFPPIFKGERLPSPLSRGDTGGCKKQPPRPSASPPIRGGDGGGVTITVSDTGIGIPSDRLEKIFDRFYQVDDSRKREHEGTGIGLALTKELVELHQGLISVQSDPGKGTTFTIILPPGSAHIKSDQFVMDQTDEAATDSSLKAYDIETARAERRDGIVSERPKKAKSPAPSVLIVEDNKDMQSFLGNNLQDDFRIHQAMNGLEGFNKAIKSRPDLIVSDVMMPVMDGFELCTRLKTDTRTSHIPVILLTARADIEDRIDGLETGADDYLTKPFEARELKVRIKNLIEQRRLLRERFRKEGILQPAEIAVTSIDQAFLQKCKEIIEKHLSEDTFSVEAFAKEIGMSRALLHRKLKAITGHSPSQLILRLRIHRAARLLDQQGGNVSEVAYQVGFNNLSYFAKCFRRQYGVSPSAYSGKPIPL